MIARGRPFTRLQFYAENHHATCSVGDRPKCSRGYNIDSLAVGETDDPQLSRMTFVVVGDNRVLEQVRKQLEKIVTVVRVVDVSSQDYVERDLMLMKVKSQTGPERAEIRELVDIFRGSIVDVSADDLMIEISGRENKIEAFIERMRPYGIIELVRTGRSAMVTEKPNHETTPRFYSYTPFCLRVINRKPKWQPRFITTMMLICHC